jgi:hypothetical protein
MPNNYCLVDHIRSSVDWHVPPPEPDAIAEAEAVIEHIEASYRKRNAERTTAIERAKRIVARCRDELAKEISPAELVKVKNYVREQREAMYGFKEFQPGPAAAKAFAGAKHAAIRESFRMLAACKCDAARLKEIHGKFADELRRELEPAKAEPGRLKILPESNIPQSVLMRKTNPWVTRTAPFDGWMSKAYVDNESDDGKVTDLRSYATQDGGIGHRSAYENYDAGDDDWMDVEFETNVGFWHKSKTGGAKQMFIKLRSVRARSWIWLDDEWGFSDSGTWMVGRFRIDVPTIQGSKEDRDAWQINRAGSPDATTYDDWVYPAGVDVWLSTARALPPNTWVYITIGTMDYHFSSLNDVSTDQAMRNQWVVKEVLIED